MQVILLEKVRNLGNLGDKVKVKSGYGRNYLIPYSKAVPATKAYIAEFEARRAELEKKAESNLAAAKVRSEALAKLTVVINARSADEGKLYGSIGVREIAHAITHAGVDVQKSEVIMPEGAIRQVGEYDITIQCHTDVEVPVHISIVEDKS